jgi:hypothetical protein
MRDETRKELDTLLDIYEQKRESPKERDERKGREEAEFCASFRSRCEEIIEPLMRDIGEYLKKRGHDYQLPQYYEHVDPSGRRTCSQRINFYPKGIDRADFNEENTPFVVFVGRADTRKVTVTSSDKTPKADGQQVTVGERSLDAIDNVLVEERILEVLRRICAP